MSRVDTQAVGGVGAESVEESRLELLGAATRAERHNRPTYLLVIAAVLMVICLIALGSSLWSRAGAAGELARQREAGERLAQAIGRLKDLRGAQSSGAVKGNEPVEGIRTRLQAAAARAGLADAQRVMPTRTMPTSKGPGVQRMHFDFESVHDEKLEPLLQWLRNATEDIPGLEVYAVTLRPDAGGWMMKVTFTRWERVGA